MTHKEQESDPKPRGQLKGSRLELRMYCCRVEDPHPPFLLHPPPCPAHLTASSPTHAQTITGAFSTNFKGRGGLHGDSRTQGCQMHGLEHMAEERGRPLMYAPQPPPQPHCTSLSGPCSHHSRTGSCPAGGSELRQLTYAHTNTSPLLDQIGWGTTCYSPIHPPTPADQRLQLCEGLVFPAP